MTILKLFPYTIIQSILLIIGGLVIIAPILLFEKLLNQYISENIFNLILGMTGLLVIWGLACFINWKKGYKVSYSFKLPHNSMLLLFAIVVILVFQIGINPFIGSVIVKLLNIQIQIDNPLHYTIYTLISMILLGPILEELIFRGTILKGFLTNYSVLKAIVYSSILFGLIHALPISVVGATLIGLFLGWIYFKTNSVGATILLHITANLTGLVVGYLRFRLANHSEWYNIYGKYSLLIFTVCSILCTVLIVRVIRNTVSKTVFL